MKNLFHVQAYILCLFLDAETTFNKKVKNEENHQLICFFASVDKCLPRGVDEKINKEIFMPCGCPIKAVDMTCDRCPYFSGGTPAPRRMFRINEQEYIDLEKFSDDKIDEIKNRGFKEVE